ncbi:MAG TPA: glutamyl-tRNA reductase [bacterium]|nr:glutamyl-tRNA reductase [bacterium]
MKFITYGMNHTTAPLEVREKYVLPPEKVKEVLQRLKPMAAEAVFLPTCNRVEFYLATDKVEEGLEEIHKIVGSFHRLKAADFKKYFYFHEGAEAFLHLFRVASSLDSMVVGEAQILGQVKEAYQQSLESGMARGFLNGVFNRAFAAAKKVRTQTEIARMPVNVSSVAVDLAKKIFRSIAEHGVLLLGAGEMSELTAKYLVDSGVHSFFIANRTLERAKALASKLKGIPLSLEEGLQKLDQVDILLTSVGGTGFVLTRAEVEKAMKKRDGRSLFIIDTGVPRNVEPVVGKLESVYLYNIDDLSSIAEGNKEGRLKAMETAETLLREEVDKLCDWLENLELVPTIIRLRDSFEAIRKLELEEFFRKHPALPEKDRQEVERLTRDLVGKLLHPPSANLKKVDSMDRFHYAKMLNEIFSLMDEKE